MIRTAYVYFLMLTAAPSLLTADDYLSNAFFGHLSNVKPRPCREESELMLKTRVKAAEMFRSVTKGLVHIDDPVTIEVKSLINVLTQKLHETRKGVTGQRIPIPRKIFLAFQKLEVDSLSFAERALREVQYNASLGRQEIFYMACSNSLYSSPDSLIWIIDNLLTRCSHWDMSSEGQRRFTQLLSDFPKRKEIPLETQSALALYAGTYLEDPVDIIISRFLNSVERLKTYGIPNDEVMTRAISEVGTDEVYEIQCFLDAVYYNNFCDKNALEKAIAAMENSFYSITVSSTICTFTNFGDTDTRSNYLSNIDRKLNKLRQEMDNYYKKVMARSFEICEPTLIRRTIEQFLDGPIAEKEYQKLGDQLIQELKTFGRSELFRHIIVTPNSLTETGPKYAYDCSDKRLSVMQDDARKVTVFHTYYDSSNSTTLVNQEAAEISANRLIKANLSLNRHDDITKEQLSTRNISGTAKVNGICELSIQHYSYFGDCQVKATLSMTNTELSQGSCINSTNYSRNAWNPLRYCEYKQTFIFP